MLLAFLYLADNGINQPVQIGIIACRFGYGLIPILIHGHNTLLNRVLAY